MRPNRDDPRQKARFFGIAHRSATGLALVVLLGFGHGAKAQSDRVTPDPARIYCQEQIDIEDWDRAALPSCQEEYRRTVKLFVEYGTEKGYFDAEGALDLRSMVGALWDWRTLVGLAPRDPFYACVGQFAGEPVDFPSIVPFFCGATPPPRVLPH